MVVLRRVKSRVFGLLLAMVSGTCVFLMLFGVSLKLPPPPSTISFLRVPLRALHDFPLQSPGVTPATSSSVALNNMKENCGNGGGGGGKMVAGLPPLYIITPTYPRAEQIPEITRTAQTLLHVPNLVWLVSEDAPVPTQALLSYLNESAINSVYLRVQMPAKYMKAKNKPRGVANRMAGLNWVRQNAKDGVFYFADDDNTYDVRLFEQMRWTNKVSMFPVGLVTKLGVSTPIVRDGKVVGFYDGWIANRKFPVDMAGFAVSVSFLLSLPNNASMPFTVGYEEDGFIKSLGITSAEIEPLAFNCTKIWVWHTQTKKNAAATPVTQNNITMGSNLDVIKSQLWKDPPGTAKEKEKKEKERKEKERKEKERKDKEKKDKSKDKKKKS